MRVCVYACACVRACVRMCVCGGFTLRPSETMLQPRLTHLLCFGTLTQTKVEREIAAVEKELDQEKRMAENIVADMTPNMRRGNG